MPIKRRLDKRGGLDDYHRQQLLEGPDACLVVGVGYLARFPTVDFDALPEEQREAILADMRTDWTTYGAAMMVRWRAGEREPTVRPWVFPHLGGPDTLPWAGEQFGEP